MAHGFRWFRKHWVLWMAGARWKMEGLLVCILVGPRLVVSSLPQRMQVLFSEPPELSQRNMVTIFQRPYGGSQRSVMKSGSFLWRAGTHTALWCLRCYWCEWLRRTRSNPDNPVDVELCLPLISANTVILPVACVEFFSFTEILKHIHCCY